MGTGGNKASFSNKLPHAKSQQNSYPNSFKHLHPKIFMLGSVFTIFANSGLIFFRVYGHRFGELRGINKVVS
jgi:hypothetical protein